VAELKNMGAAGRKQLVEVGDYSCHCINIARQYQSWAKLFLIALKRYSVALKRLTFNAS
jgi:hypothetical protein